MSWMNLTSLVYFYICYHFSLSLASLFIWFSMNLYCCKLRRVLCFGRPVGLELPKYADMTEKEDENERERERRRKTEIYFKIRMYESIIKSFFLSILLYVQHNWECMGETNWFQVVQLFSLNAHWNILFKVCCDTLFTHELIAVHSKELTLVVASKVSSF